MALNKFYSRMRARNDVTDRKRLRQHSVLFNKFFLKSVWIPALKTRTNWALTINFVVEMYYFNRDIYFSLIYLQLCQISTYQTSEWRKLGVEMDKGQQEKPYQSADYQSESKWTVLHYFSDEEHSN